MPVNLADGAQTRSLDNALQILLIEDSRVEARLMQAVFAKIEKPNSQRFQLHCRATLADGLARLSQGGIDLVLLDLTLPDAEGLETLVRVREQELDTPVVVLTGLDDEALADGALKRGAQDYLVKGQFGSQLLVRAIRYAIERHRLLRSLSLLDDLTGLYNRRGFMALAEQQLKLARRNEKEMLIIYADMDGLKSINDRFGHLEGSQAITQSAEILRNTFRTSDVVARLGGDEFAVLAVDATDADAQQLIARLYENIHQYNLKSNKPYALSLSAGVSRPTDNQSSVEDLLVEADEAMYEQKRSKLKLQQQLAQTSIAQSLVKPLITNLSTPAINL